MCLGGREQVSLFPGLFAETPAHTGAGQVVLLPNALSPVGGQRGPGPERVSPSLPSFSPPKLTAAAPLACCSTAACQHCHFVPVASPPLCGRGDQPGHQHPGPLSWQLLPGRRGRDPSFHPARPLIFSGRSCASAGFKIQQLFSLLWVLRFFLLGACLLAICSAMLLAFQGEYKDHLQMFSSSPLVCMSVFLPPPCLF